MSSDDEQSEHLETTEDCQIDAQTQGAHFQGFDNNTFLQYSVLDSELNNEAELVVLDRLNATEQLINRATDDSGDTYRDLETVSDRLRVLGPLQDIDTEFEIAQFRTNLTLSPEHRTSTRRNSLVNQRVSFFENMSTTPGSSSFTITTTTSMATTATTTAPLSTTTAVTSALGLIPSVMPPAAVLAAAPVDIQWLEYRLEFASDNLRDRTPDILHPGLPVHFGHFDT